MEKKTKGRVPEYSVASLSQFTTTGTTSSTIDYLLDGVGNWITTSADGTAVSSTVNSLDQFTTSGSVAYAYDLAGRLTEASGPDGTTGYSWDTTGRLAQVSLPTGTTVTYTYDVDGNLTTRTQTPGTTSGGDYTSVDYLYDTRTGLPHAVAASDGTWWLYVDGHPIAQHTDGQTFYLHSDIHDDIRLTTDSTGTVTDTFTWTTDGVLEARTGSTPITVGYRGETTDPANNLIWLRARWYDPVSARFLSADPWMGNPSTPVSLNRYLYANADPTNLHDPTGLEPEQATLAGQVNTMVVAATLFAIRVAPYTAILAEIATVLMVINSTHDTPVGVDDSNDDEGIDLRNDAAPATQTGSSGVNPPRIASPTYCQPSPSDPGQSSRIEPADWNDHIYPRHIDNAVYADKSKFSPAEDISSLICEALGSTPRAAGSTSSGLTARTYDMGRPIGNDIASGPTQFVTVFTRADGSVVTAHPGWPSPGNLPIGVGFTP